MTLFLTLISFSDQNILQDAAYCSFAASAINVAMENAKEKGKVYEALEKLKKSYSG